MEIREAEWMVSKREGSEYGRRENTGKKEELTGTIQRRGRRGTGRRGKKSEEKKKKELKRGLGEMRRKEEESEKERQKENERGGKEHENR